LELKYPVKYGHITDFDAIDEIWRYAMYEGACASPEEKGVILTEAPMNPSENREKTTEIMFEKYKTPHLLLMPRPVLALFATGRTEGCVVQSNYDVTYITYTYESKVIKHASYCIKVGGKDVTEYLMKIAPEPQRVSSDKPFIPSFESYNTMKESVCCLDPGIPFESKKLEKELKYDMNGYSFVLSKEQYTCPEVLFNPSLIEGVEEKSKLAEIVQEGIKKCDISLWTPFYRDIVITGGSSMIPGFGYRLQYDLMNIAPCTINVKTIKPQKRSIAAWVGGSILGSGQIQSNLYLKSAMSDEEYDEYGPSLVHRKCF